MAGESLKRDLVAVRPLAAISIAGVGWQARLPPSFYLTTPASILYCQPIVDDMHQISDGDALLLHAIAVTQRDRLVVQ